MRLEKMVPRELLGRRCWICSTTKAELLSLSKNHCHPEKTETGCPCATDPGPTTATGAATGAGASSTQAEARGWQMWPDLALEQPSKPWGPPVRLSLCWHTPACWNWLLWPGFLLIGQCPIPGVKYFQHCHPFCQTCHSSWSSRFQGRACR